MPGTDHEHRVAVGRRGAQQAVAGDRDRLVQTGQPSRAPRREAGAASMACASTCSAQPPPSPDVYPSVRPLLTTRLSRLRHEDVQPRAQLAHGGSIPRASARDARDRRRPGCPTGMGTTGPASITRPAISWPRTKGNEPIEASVGDGPTLWANRWRSLPQIPPAVTATRAHAATGQLGLGQVDERRREGRVGHVELDGAHAASVGALGSSVAGPARAVRSAAPLGLRRGAGLRRPLSTRSAVEGSRLVEGFLAPDELRSRPGGPVAALPEAGGVLRRSGPVHRVRRRPVRRGGGVPLPGVGRSTVWPSTRSGRRRRALPRDDATCTSTRWSSGPSTGEPPTTTSPCTATSAATAWSSPAPTAGTSS